MRSTHSMLLYTVFIACTLRNETGPEDKMVLIINKHRN